MDKKAFDNLKAELIFEDRHNNFADYIQSSVLVPLILKDGQYHVVFEKRSAHIRQGGEVCFPGGRLEPEDTTPEVTALRETSEELGYDREKIDIIGSLETLVLPTGSMIYAYLGMLQEPIDETKISEDEVDHLFYVPLAFFLENEPEMYETKVLIHPYLIDEETGEKQVLLPTEKLNLPLHYSEPWGNVSHNIYCYHTEEALIWGLTAKIVFNLVNKIKATGFEL